MPLATNIESLLGVRLTAADGTLMPSELLRWFPAASRSFDGCNTYYGINKVNVALFECSGKTEALNMRHVSVLNALVAELHASTKNQYTLNISLEPLEEVKPYDYVANHLDLVKRLAQELDACQKKVVDTNPAKRLRIIVRFASEMNDTAIGDDGKLINKYAGDPDSFKKSFEDVSRVFKQSAPDVEMAFSPAARADLKEADVHAYWPGPDVVDIISCTWYIGDISQIADATLFFTDYFLHRQGLPKSFGIDEFGGCKTVNRDQPDETGKDNDEILQGMNDTIKTLIASGIKFSYASIFFDSKWGVDAKLDWL